MRASIRVFNRESGRFKTPDPQLGTNVFQIEPNRGHTRHYRIACDVVSNVDGADLRREPVVENHAVMMYSPLLHAPG